MPQRLILGFLLLLSWALPAQQSTNARVLARAELGRTEITIGDQVWLEVNISAPPGTEVAALSAGFLDEAPGIETVENNELETLGETPELHLQQRILLTSFDSGFVAVPPLPYVFRDADGRVDTAYTNDLLLEVSMLPVGDEDELRPIKGIIREPINIYDLWPLLLFALLGAIGFITYRNFQASKRVTPPPPPPPADLQALNALKALESEELWQQGQTKQYYTRLTRTFREYLSNRFDVSALEMTSKQINRALRNKTRLDDGQLEEMQELLQLSDMVKFAQATPAATLHPRSLERVRNFVRKTGPEADIVVPPPPPAPATSAASTPAVTEAEKQAPAAGGGIDLAKTDDPPRPSVPGIDLTKNDDE